ncbi:hypothetical protein [Arthrobacter sp. GMC3]|uniref:hypothetical protein n=1 Tax=Arthrobacter sp. GMC3 TaxID=2058894 RepID=UPI000CE34043|nr:hypothetical protein [Arthrobacter sp. GMC3]
MQNLFRLRPFILLAVISGLLIPMTYQMIPGASEDLKAFEALRSGAGVEATAKAVAVVEDERTTGGKHRSTQTWYCPVYKFPGAQGETKELTQRIKCSEDKVSASFFPEVPVIYAADHSYFGSFWNSEESHKELSQTSGNYVLWLYGSIIAFALSLAAIVWIIAIRIRHRQPATVVTHAPTKLP